MKINFKAMKNQNFEFEQEYLVLFFFFWIIDLVKIQKGRKKKRLLFMYVGGEISDSKSMSLFLSFFFF